MTQYRIKTMHELCTIYKDLDEDSKNLLLIDLITFVKFVSDEYKTNKKVEYRDVALKWTNDGKPGLRGVEINVSEK